MDEKRRVEKDEVDRRVGQGGVVGRRNKGGDYIQQMIGSKWRDKRRKKRMCFSLVFNDTAMGKAHLCV